MKYIGSQIIETKRLILKPQTMLEQKRLWEILIIPEVNKYFLTIPSKFKDKLLDWNKQEEYYQLDIAKANNPEVFKWSIFLKENEECIGRISCHERHDEDSSIINPNIRGIGWLIAPEHQQKGYCTEAAEAVLDYMFMKVEIEEIQTGAAIENPASWKVMEKIGFIKQDTTRKNQYTFLDEPTEIYLYKITKEQYQNKKYRV